jgi:uracil-DNA glycosylase
MADRRRATDRTAALRRRAEEAAGCTRCDLYRRATQTVFGSGSAQIQACHAWLESELALVEPSVVVCLGATAARAVLGRPVVIGSVRGAPLDGPDGIPVVVTVHPSAVLRARDDRAAMRAGLVADLEVAALAAGRSEPG